MYFRELVDLDEYACVVKLRLNKKMLSRVVEFRGCIPFLDVIHNSKLRFSLRTFVESCELV
ncbi:hypothetical protein Hanom_Chr16g01462441 [Helianthus anomalus]